MEEALSTPDIEEEEEEELAWHSPSGALPSDACDEATLSPTHEVAHGKKSESTQMTEIPASASAAEVEHASMEVAGAAAVAASRAPGAGSKWSGCCRTRGAAWCAATAAGPRG